ncbi:23S rRNA (uracil(1939)-C(5))-methyltransferase RlmD [Labrenzia sp. THAF191b]|uniref:class I SAM-dependent RNA methyltransferase n=1 Tax=unclassified Labrenzia TaxID=2648686 RepID=UPI0012686337|nr:MULTISPECIES: TRAM domain-containing protein [unclassified Labrenzia]QFT01333.1 23S rRNA (uracil(1939)-C(5))-methyltransferase RlmD [Labrenzia sp. THAF191b]QFT07646.1 23S rRNA (uracil(1939)-C(5))-methyltransferase RlmD [Labrenzia sp. THAF191a]QFT19190.1 23S rRNA (uracil(1939)-C(5))-methyltransferase RlmD [Labrenzia sp. THAF187b]
MSEREIEITTLGHRGDGVAETETGPIYVAGALPGEIVRANVVDGRAQKPVIEKPSPDRIEPVCRHYSACGGCSVQHLAEEPYLVWKSGLVEKALRDRGIETEVSGTIAATMGGRRRAVLTATRAGRHTLLGYHEKASHRLVDIAECPVLDPVIVEALPGLKSLASEVLPKKGELRMTVLVTTTGLDVALDKADKGYERKIPALSQKVVDQNLARLSVNGEVILELRPPLLDMGGIGIVAAPGSFAQATLAAEHALSKLVIDGVGKARTIADLFSGVGTFALRLGRQANVHAVEGDAAALAAFDKALRKPQGLKKVTFERRDLSRRPLVKEELEPYDAVVFDPPRAGAQAQAEQLALSRVKTIVAVSCNPATLARDLRILLDGGYVLQSVTPVDQFHYSPHIEAVAVLTRP